MSDARDNLPAGQDFPAAHSMDTTWWAVDRHGHVAKFSTGEAGCVPATIEEPQDDSVLIEELASRSEARVSFYCDDLFGQPDGKLYVRDWETRWTEVATNPVEHTDDQAYRSAYLAWVKDEASLAALRPAETAGSIVQRAIKAIRGARSPELYNVVRLPVPDKVVVWMTGAGSGAAPSAAFVRDLLARGVLLRAWAYEYWLEVERFGIYAYNMDRFDNWVAGPFEKTGDPRQPLKADLLPESFRAVAQACPLNRVDFRRDALIQPFEHGEAHCWGDDWISTTGRRHLTTEFGPDVEGETAAGEVSPIPPSITGGKTLLSLLASYLQREPGSAEVLSDYLGEAGQERMAGGETAGERFDEILLRFFTPSERLALEADFVEHLLATQQVPDDAAQTIRSAIEKTRQFAAGDASTSALDDSAMAAFSAWMPQDENEGERSRLAWAAWALARRMPLIAARTARALSAGEFSWQIERTLARLGVGAD